MDVPATQRLKATPADAFAGARRRFLAGERLDMRALAAELEIARATLYRWVGQREHLLGEVIWSLTEPIFDSARAEVAGAGIPQGAARILAVNERFVSTIVAAEPLRRFLETDREVALRILTGRGGRVQPRIVAAVKRQVEEETGHGGFSPRVPAATLAYAIVRVTEAFIYNDQIAAVEPNVDDVAQIVALLID